MIEKRPEDLSVEELRRLLLDKRRVTRHDRLEHFKRTGRVISLAVETREDAEDDILDPGRVVETPEDDSQPQATPRSQRRVWMDRLLLTVEVLAVVGLVGIGLAFFTMMRTLNQEVASSMQQPSPEPTALITAVVLPSGHTPPNAEGGAQPNEAEIPEHLRPLVQSIANIPIPTPSPAHAIRIQIPAIGVDAPIVMGDDFEQLKKGVGQFIFSPNPGENGNLVLSAHNDIFGEIFRDLDRLQPGDVVIVFTSQRQFTYIVTGTQVVEPTRVEVMAPTPNPTVTLISCYPYLIDNQRIVVSAALQTP
jgi:sortase A